MNEMPTPLTRTAVLAVVKSVFEQAAQRLQTRGEEYHSQTARLRNASTHWQRHTAATRTADSAELRHVVTRSGTPYLYLSACRGRSQGINHLQLPVNRPHATTAQNYGRDGAMRGNGNGNRGPNYEPNSFSDAPKQTNEPVYAPLEIHGWTGSDQWQKHEAAKERLIQSIAGGLGAVTRQDIIDRPVSYFRQADADYGARLDKAIKAVQAKIKGDETSVQVGKPAHDSSKS